MTDLLHTSIYDLCSLFGKYLLNEQKVFITWGTNTIPGSQFRLCKGQTVVCTIWLVHGLHQPDVLDPNLSVTRHFIRWLGYSS